MFSSPEAQYPIVIRPTTDDGTKIVIQRYADYTCIHHMPNQPFGNYLVRHATNAHGVAVAVQRMQTGIASWMPGANDDRISGLVANAANALTSQVGVRSMHMPNQPRITSPFMLWAFSQTQNEHGPNAISSVTIESTDLTPERLRDVQLSARRSLQRQFGDVAAPQLSVSLEGELLGARMQWHIHTNTSATIVQVGETPEVVHFSGSALPIDQEQVLWYMRSGQDPRAYVFAIIYNTPAPDAELRANAPRE